MGCGASKPPEGQVAAPRKEEKPAPAASPPSETRAAASAGSKTGAAAGAAAAGTGAAAKAPSRSASAAGAAAAGGAGGAGGEGGAGGAGSGANGSDGLEDILKADAQQLGASLTALFAQRQAALGAAGAGGEGGGEGGDGSAPMRSALMDAGKAERRRAAGQHMAAMWAEDDDEGLGEEVEGLLGAANAFPDLLAELMRMADQVVLPAHINPRDATSLSSVSGCSKDEAGRLIDCLAVAASAARVLASPEEAEQEAAAAAAEGAAAGAAGEADAGAAAAPEGGEADPAVEEARRAEEAKAAAAAAMAAARAGYDEVKAAEAQDAKTRAEADREAREGPTPQALVRALGGIVGLVQDYPGLRTAALARGAPQILARIMLRHTEKAAAGNAALALAALAAGPPPHKSALIRAGAIEALLAAMRGQTAAAAAAAEAGGDASSVVANAANAIANLATGHPAGGAAVAAAGGFEVLLGLCGVEQAANVRANAAGVLVSLAGAEESYRATIVKKGGVRALALGMLRGPDGPACNAATALFNLAAVSPPNLRPLMAQAEGPLSIAPALLLAMAGRNASGASEESVAASTSARINASAILLELCKDPKAAPHLAAPPLSVPAALAALAAGRLPPQAAGSAEAAAAAADVLSGAADLLYPVPPLVRGNCLLGLMALARMGPAMQLELGRCGAVAALLELIAPGQDPAMQVNAANAICSLAAANPDIHTALVEAQCVPLLAHLLLGGGDLARANVCAVFVTMMRDERARQQLQECGGLSALIRMVAAIMDERQKAGLSGPASADPGGVLCNALGALAEAAKHAELRRSLMQIEFGESLGTLVRVLRDGPEPAQVNASAALCHLCREQACAVALQRLSGADMLREVVGPEGDGAPAPSSSAASSRLRHNCGRALTRMQDQVAAAEAAARAAEAARAADKSAAAAAAKPPPGEGDGAPGGADAAAGPAGLQKGKGAWDSEGAAAAAAAAAEGDALMAAALVAPPVEGEEEEKAETQDVGKKAAPFPLTHCLSDLVATAPGTCAALGLIAALGKHVPVARLYGTTDDGSLVLLASATPDAEQGCCEADGLTPGWSVEVEPAVGSGRASPPALLLQRAVAAEVPVTYRLLRPSMSSDDTSGAASESEPADCLREHFAHACTVFAALPLTGGQTRSRASGSPRPAAGFLWLACPDTHAAAGLLQSPAALSQLGWAVSIALAPACAPPPSSLLESSQAAPPALPSCWLAAATGSLRRVHDSPTLHALVAELCRCVEEQVQLACRVEARCRVALLPYDGAASAFLLQPDAQPPAGGSANTAAAEARGASTPRLMTALSLSTADARANAAAAAAAAVRVRAQSLAVHSAVSTRTAPPGRSNSQHALLKPPAHDTPARSCGPVPPRSCGPSSTGMSGSGSGSVRIVPLPALERQTSTAANTAPLPHANSSALQGLLPPPPSLHARAFEASHTLLGKLAATAPSFASPAPRHLKAPGRRIASPGPSSPDADTGPSADVAAAISLKGSAGGPESGPRARGGGSSALGLTVPDVARWLQDVTLPSRDLYLVTGGALPTCLVLVGLPLRDPVAVKMRTQAPANIRSDNIGSGGLAPRKEEGGMLAVYLAFPTPLPPPLLEAVREAACVVMGQLLAAPLRAKLSGDLAPELSTLRSGVPGSYAVIHSPPPPSPAAAAAASSISALQSLHVNAEGSVAGDWQLVTTTAQGLLGDVLPPGRLARTVTLDSLLNSQPLASPLDATNAPSLLRGAALTPKRAAAASPTRLMDTGPLTAADVLGGAHDDALSWSQWGGDSGVRSSGKAPRVPRSRCPPPASPLSAPDCVVVGVTESGEFADSELQTQPTMAAVLAVHEAGPASSVTSHMRPLMEAILGTLRNPRPPPPPSGEVTAGGVATVQGWDAAWGSTMPQASGTLDTLPSESNSSALNAMFGFGSGARDEEAEAEDAEMEDLQLLEVLGEGAGGVVLRGCWGTTPVAVKLMEVPNPESADAGAPDGAADRMTEARRVMLRNAMELAVMKSVTHANTLQAYGIYDNVMLEKRPARRGVGNVCTIRRARDGPSADAQIGGEVLPPVCTAIVMELCSQGSLASALSERRFPQFVQRRASSQRASPRAGNGTTAAEAANVLTSGLAVDMQGIYLTLLEIALALRHLHSKRLVHRDVKPANVLLRAAPSDPRGWTCRLADYGFALALDKRGPRASGSEGPSPSGGGSSVIAWGEEKASSGGGGCGGGGGGWYTVQDLACGTVTHMAPEAMHRNARIDASVDVFSFGIIMWELLCSKGNRPYARLHPDDIPKAVLNGLRPVFPALAQACWDADPSRRPRSSDLVAAVKALVAGGSAAQAQRAAA
ncbi:hypothetical protein HYH03_013005 [Edaphochlamys debaryana]|uniref:Protein kinase domain-containing protein n=1 Tax=Edaphochlamys debaryana TaxID=47281 RepID=A0A836BTW8_9CHLO|nr:hypothetical protein HYH03_013005 [Edaphochlamys debaryana]|eukprot:KAG2488502.1 hypothetical protein HYH03_013005 [Edaphochlamys debaryana]